ncbi:PAS domain S-box protein [Bacillus badius]|uniref:histidine kinase n=1 Tax=Bacillus badius TaxID=1455 RepID=A0ABR5AW24_BACBA|nr:PAS domain S-box protein [Bacillus badius]KIL74448.1 phosphodiesterase [Bacillus badius]KIL78920.1 phosphodiesterase [Bacillus badius]MED4715637.1 PAS domain S-box protein [Bacillus badius]
MKTNETGLIVSNHLPVEHNNWYDAFLKAVCDPLCIFNQNGKIIAVNEAFEQEYGWKLTGRQRELLPTIPTHLEGEFDFLKQKLLSGKTVHHFKTIRLHREGSLLHVKISVSPIHDENGQFIAAVCVTRNITQKIETALLLDRKVEELKENEKKFLDISENINDIFCVYDRFTNRALYVSPSYEKILGHSKGKMYQDLSSFLSVIHPEDRERFKRFAHEEAYGERSEIEYQAVHKDGAVIWLRSRKIIAEHFKNRVIVITQDITNLKEKEILLNKRDKLSAVGQLAAGIAHEVRNPLTAIKGFTQLWGQETHHKYSQIILAELDRIESIMQEFLMLAKPNQEMFFVEKEMNDILRDTIAFMEPEAMLYGVQLILEPAEKLPLVRVEEKQIKQVMLNLIKNAIEAMPDGGQVTIRTKKAGDDSIGIEVADNGIGISQERIPHLGEPFYSNKEKGTGLGLMVSFKIIEHHKGKIFFESEEGKGTKVEIRLPSSR